MASLEPVIDGGVNKTGLRKMMCDDFWLGVGDCRKPVALTASGQCPAQPHPRPGAVAAACARSWWPDRECKTTSRFLPLLPASMLCLGIRCVQRLAASLRPRKEFWRKPYHPVGVGLLYLTQITAPYFIRASIRRHFKNAPPLAFFGLLRGPIILSMPPSPGLALLFALLLTSGLLFCADPALLHGPPFGIASSLASRA
jgi:hypothetical protein